jgi:hypothetical protein
MRFMIIVKGNRASEAGEMGDEAIFAAMAEYHEALAKAGALLDAAGLQPTSRGARVKYKDRKPTWIDGPFPESKEIVAGYTLIQVGSREEAKAWALRFPAPFGREECEIEVRPLYDLEDLGDSEAIQRFRELERGKQSSGNPDRQGGTR